MRGVGAWASEAAGVLVVLLTSGSVARALLLPGSRVGFLLSKIDQATDRLFRLATRRMESHASRSRIRSIHAPVILAAQLWSWLALYLVGYALLLWPITHRLGSALRESGSSLLTLGFAVTRSGPGLGIDLLAAATGLIVSPSRSPTCPRSTTRSTAVRRTSPSPTCVRASPPGGRSCWRGRT